MGSFSIIVHMLDYVFGGNVMKIIFLGKYTANAPGGLIAG